MTPGLHGWPGTTSSNSERIESERRELGRVADGQHAATQKELKATQVAFGCTSFDFEAATQKELKAFFKHYAAGHIVAQQLRKN
jgi:hypothetical protein